MANKLLIVIGSGPGIGSTTAAQFASQGFHVALLSRNKDRLKEDASRVSSGSSNVKVNTYAVDVGDHKALQSTLEKVRDDLGDPEVVLFNAARVAPSEFGKIKVDRLTEDFQIMNVGLYVVAEWAIPILEKVKQQTPDSHPSFLITGGGISKYPDQAVFALALQKASQANFAGSLAQIAGPKGVHIATVRVNAVVEDSNPVVNAKNIASKFWELYQQKQDNWNDILDVGDVESIKK